MRRIALVNQKGGVGKTTSAVNLGAALALQGKRVLLVDLDPQANLSTHLGLRAELDQPTSYSVLCRGTKFGDAVRATAVPNLSVVPTNLDLSGAELELASALGRENILRDALDDDVREREASGAPAWDFVLFDCPPSLGLLSVNGLVAATEVFIAVQTEFFALQGMSKLREVVGLLQRRLNPRLRLTGIIPCLYDTRLKLAREVLAELRRYFPEQVFARPIHSNIKLAEAPSYGQSIFEYAPDSSGARDYRALAAAVLGISEEEALARELSLRAPEPARSMPRPPPRRRVPGADALAAAEAATSDVRATDAGSSGADSSDTATSDKHAHEPAIAARHANTPTLDASSARDTAAASTNGAHARKLDAHATEVAAHTTNANGATNDTSSRAKLAPSHASAPRDELARDDEDDDGSHAATSSRTVASTEPRLTPVLDELPELPPEAFEIDHLD